MFIDLMRETSRVWIIAVGRQRGISNHGALKMKAAVSEVEDKIWNIFLFSSGIQLSRLDGHGWRCAAKNLALRQRGDLRNYRVIAFSPKYRYNAVNSSVELNGPNERNCFSDGKILCDGVDEMLRVDADRDKDV